eukprot:1195331-Prorocentrum_minimum.AAC.4
MGTRSVYRDLSLTKVVCKARQHKHGTVGVCDSQRAAFSERTQLFVDNIFYVTLSPVLSITTSNNDGNHHSKFERY